MTINSLKELDKLVLLCKKRGIKSIKIDNIEFSVEAAAPKASSTYVPTTDKPGTMISPGGITEDTRIDMTDELTEEQLLFYSAGSVEQ